MSRLYYVAFDNVSVSAAQDLWELTPGLGVPIVVLGGAVTVRDDETNQQLDFTVQRRVGSFSAGSSGTPITPVRGNTNDLMSHCAVKRNNTVRASGGTLELFVAEGVPSQGGFQFNPTLGMAPTINPGEIFLVGLENAPGAAIGLSGWIAFMEV